MRSPLQDLLRKLEKSLLWRPASPDQRRAQAARLAAHLRLQPAYVPSVVRQDRASAGTPRSMVF